MALSACSASANDLKEKREAGAAGSESLALIVCTVFRFIVATASAVKQLVSFRLAGA